MTKQTINTNSPEDLINVGNSANDRKGDSLRAAFIKLNDAADKIDANFTELYARAAADATDRLVNGDATVLLGTDGILTFTNGTAIGSFDSPNGIELKAFANNDYAQLNYNEDQYTWLTTDGVYVGTNWLRGEGKEKTWQFNQAGTLTVPGPTTATMTLTFDAEHYVATDPKPTLTLTSAPWELMGEYVYAQDGQSMLALNNIWPTLDNPGYESGDQFTFDASVHGIVGYTLTITLNDVVQAGPAGWTANIAASEPPVYPSTVNSNGAIKLTSNSNSWIFGTDGKLTFPDTLTIADSAIGRRLDGGENNFVGSRLIFTDNTSTLESYADPDGLNNMQYGRVSTGIMTASLSAYQEDVAGQTGSELTINASGMQITQGDGIINNTLNFNGDGLKISTDLQFGNSIRFTKTDNIQVFGGATTTIFTGESWMTSLKLVITVEGRLDGDGTNTDHTQTCEATVAASYNTSAEPVMSVYGSVYTSPAPLATFAVRRGPGNIILIDAINSQATKTMYVKTSVIQFVSAFD